MVIFGVLLAIVLGALCFAIYTVGREAGLKRSRSLTETSTSFIQGYAQAVCDHQDTGEFCTNDKIVTAVVKIMQSRKDREQSDTTAVKD
jgi:hypothetical protein